MISVTVFMIFCLFGALDDAERSNSAGVHSRQDLEEQINVCVYTQTHTDTRRTHSHACTYPPTRLYTQRHTNTRAASHTHMHAAYKTCYAHTHTQTHTMKYVTP